MGLIRDSFVLFKNWTDAINALPEEYQLETYKALVQYGTTGEMPENLSAVANAMLISFSVGMENSICRYSASVENGKLGGRPSKTKANPDKPNKTQQNLEKPSETQQNPDEPNHNLNVNVNVNDNNIKKEINKEKSCFSPSAPKGGRDLLNSMISTSGLGDNVQTALMRWITYKKFAYKKVGFDSLLSIVQKKVNLFGEQAVVDLIDECMSNTYKGIVWDKLIEKNQHKTEVGKQSAQKNYDYGADCWG